RRLPRPTFRRDDARLASELETASDFRFDPAPAAEPPREVLDSQEPLENGRPGRCDSHHEVVVKCHARVRVRSAESNGEDNLHGVLELAALRVLVKAGAAALA